MPQINLITPLFIDLVVASRIANAAALIHLILFKGRNT